MQRIYALALTVVLLLLAGCHSLPDGPVLSSREIVLPTANPALVGGAGSGTSPLMPQTPEAAQSEADGPSAWSVTAPPDQSGDTSVILIPPQAEDSDRSPTDSAPSKPDSVRIIPAPTQPAAEEPSATQPPAIQPATAPSATEPSPIQPQNPTPPVETAPASPAGDPTQEAAPALLLLYFGQYSGLYPEDETDEQVTGIASALVENPSDQHLKFAELHIMVGKEEAVFRISDLPPGSRVLALESNRMAVQPEPDFQFLPDKTVTVFEKVEQAPAVEFRTAKGSITATNTDTSAIRTLDVSYKLRSDQQSYLGGISYHVRFNRLEPGQSATAAASHFDPDTCEIVCVKAG